MQLRTATMDPTITVRLPTRAGRLYQDLCRHKLSFSGSSIDKSKYTLTEPVLYE